MSDPAGGRPGAAARTLRFQYQPGRPGEEIRMHHAWLHLLKFGMEAVGNAIGSRMPTADRPTVGGEVTFPALLRRCLFQLGILDCAIRDEGGTFEVEAGGRAYVASCACPDGRTAYLSVLSSVRFGHVPEILRRAMARHNQTLRHCQWQLRGPDSDQGQYFYVLSAFPAAELTPGRLEAALSALLAEAAGLDQALAENGYAG